MSRSSNHTLNITVAKSSDKPENNHQFYILHIHQWLTGTPVSSTNKTDCHDITEIFLKAMLNTKNQTNILARSQIWNKGKHMNLDLKLEHEMWKVIIKQRMSDCCLTLLTIFQLEQAAFQWDDDVCFVIDQYA